MAVFWGNIEIVKILLTHAEENNIDVDARNNKGQSAIDIALGNVQLYLMTILYTRWR